MTILKRKKGKRTRNVDAQNNDQEPPVSGMQLSRGPERLEDHGAFAADSEGVENVEGVVSVS